MLPNDLELQEGKKKEWPLIPSDVYQTEITDIEYKEVDNRWKEKETDPDKKQVMSFEFTIIEDGPLYGRRMWKQMAPIKPYPPSGGRESWVYRLASAMAGHPITRAEADKFNTSDINGYIHQQVRITISETLPKENGKRYNNLDGFLTAKQQLPPFDEAKVPKDNQPEPTGYEKARQVANTLPGAKKEAVAPDIQEMADQMQDEVNIDEIPFN